MIYANEPLFIKRWKEKLRLSFAGEYRRKVLDWVANQKPQ